MAVQGKNAKSAGSVEGQAELAISHPATDGIDADNELLAALASHISKKRSRTTPSADFEVKKKARVGRKRTKIGPAKRHEKYKEVTPAAKEASTIADKIRHVGPTSIKDALVAAIQRKSNQRPSKELETEAPADLQRQSTAIYSRESAAAKLPVRKIKSTLVHRVGARRRRLQMSATRARHKRSNIRLIKCRTRDNYKRLNIRSIKSELSNNPPDIIRPLRKLKFADQGIETLKASDLKLIPIEQGELPVPRLSYGLERVLFNPGVYQLQDPRSRVFNFDPYLQTIMPVNEFDFTLLKKFITSSRDETLLSVARSENKKYLGSTSSTTSVLAHFHYLLSQWRPINTALLTKKFPVDLDTFTQLQRAPTAIFLRYRDGCYAIDADKQFDVGNVLSMLGQSMEKLLTLPTEEFEQYRKAAENPPSKEERSKAEAYHYTTMGDFLLRSQLDAHDPRIPGTGMFDLKTRAVVSIRMDTSDYEYGSGYQIHSRHGEFESYEREYYDMIRAAFMKYSLQVRMGRMDGIFVAFHNTERIFGFQYISLPEMDLALHGTEDTTLGDSEFKLSLSLMNKALDRATQKFPEKSLRLFFETRGMKEGTPYMYIFAEPIDEDDIEQIQSSKKESIEKFERDVLGLHGDAETEEKKKAEWDDIHTKVQASMAKDEAGTEEANEEARKMESNEDYEVDEENRVLDEEDQETDEVEELDRNNQEAQEAAEAASESLEENHHSESTALDEATDDLDPEDQELEEGQPSAESITADELINDDAAPKDQDFESQEESTELKPQEEESLESGREQEIVDEDALDEATSVDPDLVKNNQESLITDDSVPDDEEGNATTTSTHLSPEDALVAEMTSAGSQKQRPILAMYLTIRNKVNGRSVVRPGNLIKSDDWTVEYSLDDIPSQVKARALYVASQKRRRTILDWSKEDRKNRQASVFIQKIRRLSAAGRDYRNQTTEKEKTAPIRVLDGAAVYRSEKS